MHGVCGGSVGVRVVARRPALLIRGHRHDKTFAELVCFGRFDFEEVCQRVAKGAICALIIALAIVLLIRHEIVP